MKTLRNMLVVVALAVLAVLVIVLWPSRGRDREHATTAPPPAAQPARGAMRAAEPQPLVPDEAAPVGSDTARTASAPAIETLAPSATLAEQPRGRTLEAAKLETLEPTTGPLPAQPAGKQLRVIR